MRRAAVLALSAWLTALALPQSGAAEPTATADPSSRRGEVLLMEMVFVTGKLRIATLPQASGTALELDSGAMGRYRIDEHGLGEELKQHVGEEVTVVAFVEPSAETELPLLRVQRFTIHDEG